MAWGAVFRPQSPQVQVITILFAGLLILAAFTMAGRNLDTWTGFGSVPYWNAYVALVVADLVMWVPGCLVSLSAIRARVAPGTTPRRA